MNLTQHDGLMSPEHGGGPGRHALRAIVFGAAVCVLPLGAIVLLAAAGGLLSPELLPAIALGFGLALLAVGLAAGCHGRLVQPSHLERDARLASQRLQTLLAAAFAAKLAVFGVGFGALALAGVKFTVLVAFGLAFAGAALMLQLVTALRLARLLAARARATPVHGR